MLAAIGASLAVPGAAFAQGPIETTDDPLYNETTAPLLENTIFHTDQGADYESDGGTGAGTDTDYHSDDNHQEATVTDTIGGTVVKYEATYDQIADKSVNDADASGGVGSLRVNYTRDREDNDASLTVKVAGETVISQTAPTVAVPTGYQIYKSVFGG